MSILCGTTSGPTARLIRDSIFEKTGRKLLVVKKPELAGKIVHLRYGHAGELNPGVKDISPNSRAGILTLSNKAKFCRLMTDNGVKSPVFYTYLFKPDVYPVLIRKTLHGFGAKGIIVAQNEAEFKENMTPGYWWTYAIACTREFRVEVWGGKVRRIFLKFKENEPEGINIRNGHNGYSFKIRDLSQMTRLVGWLEEKVIPVIPAEVYGLDVGEIKKGTEWCVFEGNSAPGMNTKTVDEFTDWLIPKIF